MSRISQKSHEVKLAYKNDEESMDEEKHHSCHNVKVFLVLMCVFSITQGFAVNGINNVNIPMYEKRFGLSSVQTGLEASFYDVIAGCSVLLAGYYGTQFHQPRLLGLASLSLALGSLSMALPHFITSSYQPNGQAKSFCYSDGNTNSSNSLCATTEGGVSDFLYMLLLGQGLHGLAGTALYAIGPAFIDGSVSAKHSPLYLGLFYGSSVLGPAAGYVAGGSLLDLYVESPDKAPKGLTVNSPAWVGAWWIGFLASFGSCFLLAFPLMTFPRVLPGTERRRKDNEVQAHDHGSQHKADQAGFGLTLRDMPAAIMLLLRNPVFVSQCLISSSEGFLLSGMSTFLPKFIANQFNQKPGWAAMLTGFVAVPGGAAGQVFGGLLVKKFNMKVRDILKFNMACSVVVIAAVSVYWARCDQGNIAGVTVGYDGLMNHNIDLNNPCNSGCGCDTYEYDPVCMGGVEYFTSCYAGCPTEAEKRVVGDKTEMVYRECRCAHSRLLNTSHTQNSQQEEAIIGKCSTSCNLLYAFIAVVFIALLGTFMMSTPGTTVVLRSVNDKQRTLALSIQQMSMRFLGTIPGPLVFGKILDGVCLVWQEKCDGPGSCWIYNSAMMGQQFFIITVCVKVITIGLLVTAFCLYRPPPPHTDSDSTSERKSQVTAL